MALGKMTKGCRLLPLYQTSPIPLHLAVLQTLTSFFCLVLFLLHQLASHQLQLLDPQAMHQPGYQTGRMNLESLMKPCYLQIHDKHQIQKVFRSTAIDQIPASQWIYTCCHELKESSDQGSTGLILLQALCKIVQEMLFTMFALET
jgi:phosphoglycerate-specific signal transduction histidine kinase